MTVVRRLTALLTVLVWLVAAAPAAALDAGEVRSALTRAAAGGGGLSGYYARDLETGRVLVSLNEDIARIPASVEKLFVTSAALLRFGPDATLDTRVTAQTLAEDADLYLVGGGDPTLDSAGLATLARQVGATGVQRVGDVVGDGSRFDERFGGPRTGFAFDFDIGTPVVALIVGRGRQGDPDGVAAARFAAALRRAGVRVGGAIRDGRAPAGASDVAAHASPPIRSLIARTNVPSDNFMAETLLKALGAEFGAGGTTGAGAQVVRDTLDDLGVRPRIADGSGLSRANRATPRQVVRLLERMAAQEIATTWRSSLAVAGRSGTVRRRLRGTAAAGRCYVKTGTIRAVSNLAGVCRTRSGAEVGFAWLMNGVDPAGARRIQDRMTAVLARYQG